MCVTWTANENTSSMEACIGSNNITARRALPQTSSCGVSFFSRSPVPTPRRPYSWAVERMRGTLSTDVDRCFSWFFQVVSRLQPPLAYRGQNVRQYGQRLGKGPATVRWCATRYIRTFKDSFRASYDRGRTNQRTFHCFDFCEVWVGRNIT